MHSRLLRMKKSSYIKIKALLNNSIRSPQHCCKTNMEISTIRATGECTKWCIFLQCLDKRVFNKDYFLRICYKIQHIYGMCTKYLRYSWTF